MQKRVDYIGVGIVFFCHDEKGNFIMSKRSKNTRDEHGKWDPGGGAIEIGERIETALEREIREEYCTDVKKFEFLGFRDVHRVNEEGNKTHWLVFDFKVLIDRKKVKNGVPNEHEEIGWFRLDMLPSPLHSQFLFFLEKYKDKLLVS